MLISLCYRKLEGLPFKNTKDAYQTIHFGAVILMNGHAHKNYRR